MKINHLTTLFAILATMLFAVGCGEEATTEEPSAATEPAADEATEPEPAADEAEPAAAEPAAEEAAAEPAAAGGSVCDRAQRCCEAYVTEMNAAMPTGNLSAATSCAGVAAARATPGAGADAACQATIDGFRTGLTGMQRTVPADCQ